MIHAGENAHGMQTDRDGLQEALKRVQLPVGELCVVGNGEVEVGQDSGSSAVELAGGGDDAPVLGTVGDIEPTAIHTLADVRHLRAPDLVVSEILG